MGKGEESGEGGDTGRGWVIRGAGRGWGMGMRAERVGTLVEGGVLQGEESGKGGDTGRRWGVAREGKQRGLGHC